MFIRQIALCEKVWRSNFGSLRAPYKLTYSVTTRCNSRCRHCLSWQQKSVNELSLEEIASFARANPHWVWVDFTGGEPTLRNDFVQIVHSFLQHQPELLYVHFATNGLQTDRVLDVCEQILVKSRARLVLTVSIDGPPRVHDAIRGVEGGFDNACRTLSELYKIKRLSVHPGMTLYPENIREIDSTIAAIQQTVPLFKPRHLHVNIPHTSSHLYHNAGKGTELGEGLNDAIKRVMKERGMPLRPFEWVEWMYQKHIASYVQTGKCPQNCAALMASCFVGPDGTLYPCSIWDTRIGNIRDTEYRLEPLLARPVVREMRKQILGKKCPNCWTPCEAYTTLAANLFGFGKDRN